MKLRSIRFDADENPSIVLAELTIEEAAFIAKFTGGLTGEQTDAIMRGSQQAKSDIYGCLIGGVFNRFWDDGLRDYLNDRPRSR